MSISILRFNETYRESWCEKDEDEDEKRGEASVLAGGNHLVV